MSGIICMKNFIICMFYTLPGFRQVLYVCYNLHYKDSNQQNMLSFAYVMICISCKLRIHANNQKMLSFAFVMICILCKLNICITCLRNYKKWRKFANKMKNVIISCKLYQIWYNLRMQTITIYAILHIWGCGS